MKNKLLIFIIALLVIIVLAITTINKQDFQKSEEQNETNIIVEQNETKQTKKVKSASAFFTAQNCANKYLGYASEKDSDKVYKLLDYDYIMQNNITTQNVIEKIETIPEQAQLKVETMYMEVIDDNSNKYYMSGLLVQDTSEGDIVLQDNFKIEVILDFQNMTFSIIPLENGGV